MQTNFTGTSQALLDGVVAVIRQQVIADMAAAEPKTSKMPQARLLTVEQAGVYLGRTPGAIRQLIHKRQIPVVRFGRSVRLDVRDLDKFVDDNRV